MLLFIGEICGRQQRPSHQPRLTPVGKSTWKVITTASTSIHLCDFSPSIDRTITNDHIAIGLSGNPVIDTLGGQFPIILENISTQLRQNNHGLLKSANGVFCGFHLDKSNSRIQLFTDYLGFRQIYIYKTLGRTIFANAQWLIEEALPANAPFDEQAVVETGVLGHPLGNRTRRKEISVLAPGHMLTLDPDGATETHQLTDLTTVKPLNLSDGAAVDAIYATWLQAVKCRLNDTKHPFSFLSGGMDSRLLVHTLKSCGTDPKTANFAPPNTMDRVFAEQAAEKMGVPIWFHPTGDLNTDFVTDTVNAWSQLDGNAATDFRDRKIWSGDGGSVGMGHVYLDDEMTRHAENGDFLKCARRFCEINNRRPVSRAYHLPNIQEKFEEWIANLMQEYAHTQPARAPYYFLMLNDQRRHLHKHYETFHQKNFDFELPFFDRRLIELIASLPATQINQHRMYDRLFHKIGGTINSTPWQTYPGHVACPLAVPKDLEYQWGGKFYSTAERKRKQRRQAWASLIYSSMPTPGQKIIKKPFVAISSLSTLLGITDRSYLYECIAPMQTKK